MTNTAARGPQSLLDSAVHVPRTEERARRACGAVVARRDGRPAQPGAVLHHDQIRRRQSEDRPGGARRHQGGARPDPQRHQGRGRDLQGGHRRQDQRRRPAGVAQGARHDGVEPAAAGHHEIRRPSVQDRHAEDDAEGLHRLLSAGRARPEGQLIDMAALLDVSDVTLRYKTSSAVVTATERVSFTVDRSDRFVLLGPSGCGKSTLLKAVGGYMKPSEGKMRISGREIIRARRRPHDDLPGVRPAAAVEDGAGKRDVSAADDAAAAAQGSRGAGARLYREGQPDPRRRCLSAHAVRRHEAARGDRARHGDGAGYPADGRAVRRARRADAAHLPGRTAAALGGDQVHGAVRHPFDRGSDQDRQPHPAAVAASRPRQGRGRSMSTRSPARTAAPPGWKSRSTICCSPTP